MPNIVEQKQFERQKRITEILETLKKLKGKDYDKKNFILEICARYGCQQRRASEYLKIAEHILYNGN